MTTAQLFAEALDTATVLLRAGATWLVLCAGACGLAVYAVVVVAWAVCRWAWKAVRGACAPAGATQGAFRRPRGLPAPPGPAETPSGRSAPSWARTEPDDIEEAA